MFDRVLEWLRTLFGRPSDPLARLDPTKLRDQMTLLDVERQRAVDAIERKEKQRGELLAKAQAEAKVSGTQSVRVQEYARQITFVDQEMSDQRGHLDQIYKQRKALHQFIRFAEQAELMRRYGLDKILGRHIDMRTLDAAIQNSVAGGALDTDQLDEATRMLEDAFAMTRREVSDPAMLRVLDEISAPAPEAAVAQPAAAREPSPAGTDAEYAAVMRDIERDL